MTEETVGLFRSIIATVAFIGLVIFAALLFVGCASAVAVKDKGVSLYQNLGKTTETLTSVTFNKDGSSTTNISTKVTVQSPAADFIKSVGGAALKGAK